MKKQTILMITLASAILFLSGCANVENQTGLFYQTFVYPFIWAIHEIGTLFGGNFGLAVIVITLIIRLVLMPFMLKTYKNQQVMKEKIDLIRPEMEAIQKRLKTAKTPQEQQEVQKEMIALYQTHQVNPLNIGCLPIIMQMPILMGLFYAIRGSEDIASHSFLWFHLGSPDLLMTMIAGLVYFLQAQISLVTVPEAQRNQMRLFMYMSPIMIVFISFKAPAALPLYWVVGGIFLILQTMIARTVYQKERKEANLTDVTEQK